MNKEVKEIIDKLDRARLIYELILTPEECHILYDYITLLEKTVKIKDKAFKGTMQELTETATEKEKLQQRIDKAVEYIENDLQSFLYSIEYKTLLNILKGSDKNE